MECDGDDGNPAAGVGGVGADGSAIDDKGGTASASGYSVGERR